ncbi:MAG: hypothetical protein ACLP7O_10560, partial [Terracidiphilus sp.]
SPPQGPVVALSIEQQQRVIAGLDQAIGACELSLYWIGPENPKRKFRSIIDGDQEAKKEILARNRIGGAHRK